MSAPLPSPSYRHDAAIALAGLAHLGARAAAPAHAALQALVTWQQRAAERHRLAALDDRLLRDLGLSRVEIEAERAKPFWRP